jgi:hypothetical protein
MFSKIWLNIGRVKSYDIKINDYMMKVNLLIHFGNVTFLYP